MLESENLLARLLSCCSITPNDAGCIGILEDYFKIEARLLNRGDTTNAYFELGDGDQTLLFVGHTDVVNPGPTDQWHHPPFSYTGTNPIIARGIVDMKGAIWAFCQAAKQYVKKHPGKIVILLTSDEEGDGKDGMQYAIQKLVHEKFSANWAIVGEPTSVNTVGDYFKHARRGSYTIYIHLQGKQGHSAYPQHGWKPEDPLQCFLIEIQKLKNSLPQYNDLSIFSINSSTHTSNIIPANITVGVNIRYNNIKVVEHFKSLCKKHTSRISLKPGALPYTSDPQTLKKALKDAIYSVTGIQSQSTCLGGTSDARFLSPITNEIIEFGLRSEYAHQINEQATVEELTTLQAIYTRLLHNLFDSSTKVDEKSQLALTKSHYASITKKTENI